MRTLKELEYTEKTDTILLGYSIGSAVLEDGKTLTIIASGPTVRFAIDGLEGYVDLNLTSYAGNAVEWLRENSASLAVAE